MGVSRARLSLTLLAAAALAAGVRTAAPASPPTLAFRVLATLGAHMDSVLWTGTRFLYVENTTNTVWAAPASGGPIQQFATMPNLVEETRCVLSPGTHGFAPGVIFCHSPDNKIYEISADGSSVSVFASLPAAYPPASDGALGFDDVGDFGYRLVAATGRSGAATPAGGLLFAIDPSGAVQQVGSYGGPGGADEVVVAPRGFGSVAGDALLSLDAGAGGGAVVAIDPSGRARTIARFSDGANPLVVIPAVPAAGGVPAAGVYLTDDESPYVYFAPASELAGFAGDLLVGTENTAQFWIVEPHGRSFRALRVRHNLRGRHYSLEQAIFLG